MFLRRLVGLVCILAAAGLGYFGYINITNPADPTRINYYYVFGSLAPALAALVVGALLMRDPHRR